MGDIIFHHSNQLTDLLVSQVELLAYSMIVSETEIGAVALIMHMTNVVVFVHQFYQILELLFRACQSIVMPTHHVLDGLVDIPSLD